MGCPGDKPVILVFESFCLSVVESFISMVHTAVVHIIGERFSSLVLLFGGLLTQGLRVTYPVFVSFKGYLPLCLFVLA